MRLGVLDVGSNTVHLLIVEARAGAAPNDQDLVERVEPETGVALQVLSREDEACLTFLTVHRWYGWSAENNLQFDIGGGLLEIVAGGIVLDEAMAAFAVDELEVSP